MFVTAACGSDTATTAGNTPAAAATTSAMASETGMSSPMESSGGMSSPMESSGGMSSPMESSGGMSSGSNDPAANLVGAGCAAYAEANPSGAGSVGGMATAKLAAAAAGNPLLTTLVAAVSGKLNPKVDLVDTLNSSEFTVFAPVDDAFKKLPAATVNTLKTDDKLLTKILTYHVIAGQLSPDQIVGTHKTLEGGEVTVTGSGDNLKVGDSTVICGGVKTANATVYLIDTVLSPPAA
ncbi:fasciclin domain-containing protein [Nakamurella sp. A5-74]|uniref:Fasciclin domain-containing protein n=1 Tax=Nakamurella sp. A5-74 TaxID=3158264 RepID=A0AAU8DWH5_9ACTN